MTFDISRYDIKANAVIDSEPVNFGEEDMTDEEILKQGFNGNTYSINGRDVDF